MALGINGVNGALGAAANGHGVSEMASALRRKIWRQS
jgi:homoaconitase/3-isopropylmalate dehydratase large subunit